MPDQVCTRSGSTVKEVRKRSEMQGRARKRILGGNNSRTKGIEVRDDGNKYADMSRSTAEACVHRHTDPDVAKGQSRTCKVRSLIRSSQERKKRYTFPFFSHS